MGLSKPITIGGGLTAAEIQTMIDNLNNSIGEKVDSQTESFNAKVDSQTSSLESSISGSGGASIDDIKTALDEKLPQYKASGIVKLNKYGTFSTDDYTTNVTIPISEKINPANVYIFLKPANGLTYSTISKIDEYSFTVYAGGGSANYYQLIEFN